MTLRRLDEHTVDTDLLKGGWVLDAGCLNFRFAKAVRSFGAKVLAIDPSPKVVDPCLEGVIFRRVALVGSPTPSALYAVTNHAEGNYLCDDKRWGRRAVFSVPCCTIGELMTENAIDMFDLVKLDIEGTEYDVLMNWPGPIARQISVEFHDFLGINPSTNPKDFYEQLLSRLSAWYKPIRWPTGRHDCLLTMKIC